MISCYFILLMKIHKKLKWPISKTIHSWVAAQGPFLWAGVVSPPLPCSLSPG